MFFNSPKAMILSTNFPTLALNVLFLESHDWRLKKLSIEVIILKSPTSSCSLLSITSLVLSLINLATLVRDTKVSLFLIPMSNVPLMKL